MNEVRLELLLGRRVVDPDGTLIGRLEEAVADVIDGEYVVRTFLVGRYALLERLGGGRLASGLVSLFSGGRARDGYAIPWDAMDLTDPRRPRCTRRKAELDAGNRPR